MAPPAPRRHSFSPILGGGAEAIELTIKVDRPLPSNGVSFDNTRFAAAPSRRSSDRSCPALAGSAPATDRAAEIARDNLFCHPHARARTAARRAWRWPHRRRADILFLLFSAAVRRRSSSPSRSTGRCRAMGSPSTTPGSPLPLHDALPTARAPHWRAARRRRIVQQKSPAITSSVTLTRARGPQPAGRGDGPTGAAPTFFFSYSRRRCGGDRAHHQGRPAAAEQWGLLRQHPVRRCPFTTLFRPLVPRIGGQRAGDGSCSRNRPR